MLVKCLQDVITTTYGFHMDTTSHVWMTATPVTVTMERLNAEATFVVSMV